MGHAFLNFGFVVICKGWQKYGLFNSSAVNRKSIYVLQKIFDFKATVQCVMSLGLFLLKSEKQIQLFAFLWYQIGWYFSRNGAVWRIFSFYKYERYLTVVHLSVHLDWKMDNESTADNLLLDTWMLPMGYGAFTKFIRAMTNIFKQKTLMASICSDSKNTFDLLVQFPVSLAFAMKIIKLQGQCFSNGQLYVRRSEGKPNDNDIVFYRLQNCFK